MALRNISYIDSGDDVFDLEVGAEVEQDRNPASCLSSPFLLFKKKHPTSVTMEQLYFVFFWPHNYLFDLLKAYMLGFQRNCKLMCNGNLKDDSFHAHYNKLFLEDQSKFVLSLPKVCPPAIFMTLIDSVDKKHFFLDRDNKDSERYWHIREFFGTAAQQKRHIHCPQNYIRKTLGQEELNKRLSATSSSNAGHRKKPAPKIMAFMLHMCLIDDIMKTLKQFGPNPVIPDSLLDKETKSLIRQ